MNTLKDKVVLSGAILVYNNHSVIVSKYDQAVPKMCQTIFYEFRIFCQLKEVRIYVGLEYSLYLTLSRAVVLTDEQHQ